MSESTDEANNPPHRASIVEILSQRLLPQEPESSVENEFSQTDANDFSDADSDVGADDIITKRSGYAGVIEIGTTALLNSLLNSTNNSTNNSTVASEGIVLPSASFASQTIVQPAANFRSLMIITEKKILRFRNNRITNKNGESYFETYYIKPNRLQIAFQLRGGEMFQNREIGELTEATMMLHIQGAANSLIQKDAMKGGSSTSNGILKGSTIKEYSRIARSFETFCFQCKRDFDIMHQPADRELIILWLLRMGLRDDDQEGEVVLSQLEAIEATVWGAKGAPHTKGGEFSKLPQCVHKKILSSIVVMKMYHSIALHEGEYSNENGTRKGNPMMDPYVIRAVAALIRRVKSYDYGVLHGQLMNDHVTRYSNEKIAPKMEILKDMEAITRAGFREKTKVACCLVAGMLTKLFLNIRRCEVGPIECFGVHFPLKSDGTSEIDLDLDGFPKKLKIVLPKQKGMTNPCWIVLWKNNGPDKLLDPVRWVILCLMFWGQTAKHLFPPFKFGEPMPTDSVTPQQESQRFREIQRLAGLVHNAKDGKTFVKYSTHSTRHTWAHWAALCGCKAEEAKNSGRWRSDSSWMTYYNIGLNDVAAYSIANPDFIHPVKQRFLWIDPTPQQINDIGLAGSSKNVSGGQQRLLANMHGQRADETLTEERLRQGYSLGTMDTRIWADSSVRRQFDKFIADPWSIFSEIEDPVTTQTQNPTMLHREPPQTSRGPPPTNNINRQQNPIVYDYTGPGNMSISNALNSFAGVDDGICFSDMLGEIGNPPHYDPFAEAQLPSHLPSHFPSHFPSQPNFEELRYEQLFRELSNMNTTIIAPSASSSEVQNEMFSVPGPPSASASFPPLPESIFSIPQNMMSRETNPTWDSISHSFPLPNNPTMQGTMRFSISRAPSPSPAETGGQQGATAGHGGSQRTFRSPNSRNRPTTCPYSIRGTIEELVEEWHAVTDNREPIKDYLEKYFRNEPDYPEISDKISAQLRRIEDLVTTFQGEAGFDRNIAAWNSFFSQTNSWRIGAYKRDDARELLEQAKSASSTQHDLVVPLTVCVEIIRKNGDIFNKKRRARTKKRTHTDSEVV